MWGSIDYDMIMIGEGFLAMSSSPLKMQTRKSLVLMIVVGQLLRGLRSRCARGDRCFGAIAPGRACGSKLCHDHGSMICPAIPGRDRNAGSKSRPPSCDSPRATALAERFIRTLKEKSAVGEELFHTHRRSSASGPPSSLRFRDNVTLAVVGTAIVPSPGAELINERPSEITADLKSAV